MTYGCLAEDFKKSWDSHFITKATIQNKLTIKSYPRDELIRRIQLQYNYRSFHIHTQFNELDRTIAEFLFKLSINSNYEIIRREARENMYAIFGQFPYSALTCCSALVSLLEQNQNELVFGGFF